MGERPAKIIPKSAHDQQTKKSRKTASPQIKTHLFSEASQKERNIRFSNKNFQIPNVNGKYLIVPPRDLYFSRETRGRIVLQKGM